MYDTALIGEKGSPTFLKKHVLRPRANNKMQQQKGKKIKELLMGIWIVYYWTWNGLLFFLGWYEVEVR